MNTGGKVSEISPKNMKIYVSGSDTSNRARTRTEGRKYSAR